MSKKTTGQDVQPPAGKPENSDGEPGWYKTLKWLVQKPYVLVAIIIFYIGIRIAGHDVLVPPLEKLGITNSPSLFHTTVTLTNSVSVDVPDPKTAACIEYAKKNQKPYWIESATQIVHLNFDRGTKKRTATFQVVYVLKLLRDIHSNDRSFTELFMTSDQRAKFTRISGTDVESSHGSNGKFDVEVEAKAGDVRTVVTGGQFEWPYDAPPRKGMGDNILLGKNDGTWNFPNDANDAIREYTLLLYSDGEPIEPIGKAAIRLKDKELNPTTAHFNRPDSTSGSALPSISARWENVFGNEEVAIHYSWPSL